VREDEGASNAQYADVTSQHDELVFDDEDNEQEDYIPEVEDDTTDVFQPNGAGNASNSQNGSAAAVSTMRNRKRNKQQDGTGAAPSAVSEQIATPSSPSKSKDSKRKSPASQKSTSKKVYLAHCWQIYFDTGLKYETEASYKESLLGSRIPQSDIETVTQFWLFWEHLNLHALPNYFNLRMFQSGVEPLWEIPRNINGAKWVLSLKHTKSANMPHPSPEAELNEKAYRRRNCWTELLMGIIGNIVFTDKDDIVGCIFSGRSHLDRLEIWSGAQLYNEATGVVDTQHASEIEKKIRYVLRLRPQAVIDFHLHRKELTKMDKRMNKTEDNAPKTPSKINLTLNVASKHLRQFSSDDSDSDFGPPPSTPSSAPSTPMTPNSKRNHFEQMAFNNAVVRQQKLHMQEVPLTPSSTSKLAVSKHIYDASQIAVNEERTQAPPRKQLSSSLEEIDMESESKEYQSNLRKHGGKNRSRKASACKQLFIKVPSTEPGDSTEDSQAPAKRYRKNSLRQRQKNGDDSSSDSTNGTQTTDTAPSRSKKSSKASIPTEANVTPTEPKKSKLKKSQRKKGKKSKKDQSKKKKAAPHPMWQFVKVFAVLLLLALCMFLVKLFFHEQIMELVYNVLPKFMPTVNKVLSSSYAGEQ